MVQRFFNMYRILHLNEFFFIRENNTLKLLKIYIVSSINKYTKALSSLLVTFFATILIIQIYFTFKKSEKIVIIQYSSSFLMICYGICCMSLPLIYGNEIKNYNDLIESKCFSVDMAYEKTKQRIVRESKIIECLCVLHIILSMAMATFHVLRIENEWELFFGVTYFKESFPDQAHVLVPVFYVFYFLMFGYLMLVPYTVVYFTLHMLFQFYILHDWMCEISGGRFSQLEELQLPYDRFYQKIVFEKMRFCIKYHSFVLRISRNLESFCHGSIGFILVIVYALSIATMGFFFWNPVVNYPRIVIQGLTLAFGCIVVIEVTERIFEKMEETYHLLSYLPWYRWNSKNQKFLLGVLTHSGTKFNIGPLQMLIINRNLLTQIIKLLWSTSALIINMKE